jgi:hypothetical protein
MQRTVPNSGAGEKAINYHPSPYLVNDDEMLEVTPAAIRLHKQ